MISLSYTAKLIGAGGDQLAGTVIAAAHPGKLLGTNKSTADDVFRFGQIDLFHYNILIYIKI